MHHVKSEGVGVNLNESIQCLLLPNPGFFKNNKKLNKSNGPIGQIKMMDQREYQSCKVRSKSPDSFNMEPEMYYTTQGNRPEQLEEGYKQSLLSNSKSHTDMLGLTFNKPLSLS